MIKSTKVWKREIRELAQLELHTFPSELELHTDELKSHPFLAHFSDLFLSKKIDLCAEIWNN